MRRIFFLFLCLLSLSVSAQTEAHLRDSLKQATEQLSFHPDSVELRLQKASWNMLLEQWAYAKEEYDYLLERNPQLFPARFFRAYANQRLGRYSFARIDYEWAVRLQPDHFEARLGLALLNQQIQHYTEAMDQLNQLVEQFPDRAEAYAARAGVEKERGLLDVAVYDFTEALRLSPNQKDYLINRLELLVRLHRMEEAKADGRRLAQLGVPQPAIKKLLKQ